MAYQQIHLPDGSIAEFPDDMPDSEIQKVLDQEFAAPAEPAKEMPGYLDRVGQDLSKRWDEGKDAVSAYQKDQQGIEQTLLQLVGKVGAGSLNDIMGEGLVSGFRSLPDSSQKFLKDKTGQAINYVADTPVGGLIKKGANAYEGFAKENPNAARSIESVGNIAGLLPMTKGASLAAEGTGTTLRSAGTALTESAAKRIGSAKADFVKGLVMPRETPTVRADQFGRASEQGILKTRVIEPTASEQAMIDTVSQLPVSNSKSLLANHNIIAEANGKEAEALLSRIKANDVAVPDDLILGKLGQVRAELEKNPYVVGEGAKAAESVMNGALEKITAQPQTASGMLQARKDFDAWVSSQKGSKVFDSERDTAVTTAIRAVRQSLNDIVAETVPSAEVKASLAKQSNYYRAMENLQGKGAFEAPNMLARTAQKIANGIPGKSMAAKAALSAAGISAGLAAPVPVLGLLAAYKTGKAMTGPTAQKAVGGLLTTTGKALGGNTRKGLLQHRP